MIIRCSTQYGKKVRYFAALLGCLQLCASVQLGASEADSPIISRVHGGPTKTAWGTGLGGDTVILATSFKFEEEAVQSAIQTASYNANALLPSTPPPDARRLDVVDRDPEGRVLGFIASKSLVSNRNFDAASGPDVVWAKNNKGVSNPVLLRSAQPWWIYPFETSPGNRVRLFGRNLYVSGPKGFNGYLAIKEKDSEKVRFVEPLRFGRNPMYELEFVVPEDLKPGEFEVYFHNGSGNIAGWGGPVALSIQKPQALNRATVAVPPSVAGSDSTQVIQEALAAAAPKRATVVLSPGIYEISETLELPEGTSIRGAGMEATTLRPVPTGMIGGFPSEGPDIKFEGYSRDWIPHMKGKGYAPLIWARDHSKVSDLRLEQDETSGIGILVAKAPGVSRRITISRVKAICHASQLSWVPSAAIRSSGDTELLTIVECEIEGRGAIEINSAVNKGLYLARNVLKGVPEGKHNVVFLRGTVESVVEDNRISGGLRAIVFQDALKHGKDEVAPGVRIPSSSIMHTMIAGNIFKDTVPRRHNDGETMFECNDHAWAGKPKSVELTGFSVDKDIFTEDLRGNFAFVIEGPGLGEFRKIVSNTSNTVTLEKPWMVKPTAESVIKVSSFATRCLWIDNTEDHIAGPLMLWGNCVENVVDGHIQREGNGFILWAWETERPVTVAFNDLINSKFIRGGNVRFLGPFVFGNSIRFNEILDFGYRANYHASQNWVPDGPNVTSKTTVVEPSRPDPNVGFEVILFPFNSKLNMPYVGKDAPISAWNILEGNHIVGRGSGIRIPDGSRHFIIRGNRVVVGESPLEVSPGNVIVD